MYRIVIHGGAGNWSERNVEAALKSIGEALEKGLDILRRGGTAGEAVVEAVASMEDSGYFNAGIGSSLNIEGVREMDAGYADSEGNIGAVSGVRRPKNPIRLAYWVARETDHVLLTGEGADRISAWIGLEEIGEIPEHVLRRYQDLVTQRRVMGERNKRIVETYYGDTVGAVALDKYGNLATAVSTGGLWLKLPGRVGDTPIYGAGFIANRYYAANATGIGEYIVESLLCRRALEEYMEVGDVYRSIQVPLKELGLRRPSSAGLIAVDRFGNIAYGHNTPSMVVAYYDGRRVKTLLSRNSI